MIQELRLNNLLDVDGNYWRVIQISNDELYFKENEDYNHILNAKPIELTEEILLKCGFCDKGYEEINKYEENLNIFCFGEDDKYKVKFHREWYGSKKEKEDIYICFYQSDDYITIIKYLHQLQNLYFVLNNQELTINL